MIKEHAPVVIEEPIPGSREVGADPAGAERGERGYVVDLRGTPRDPAGYTVEIIMDEEGRSRLVDAGPSQVRLDWKRYWTPERVRELRAALGKTQKEMGKEIWSGSGATGRKNLANVERGANRPSASAARALERLEDQQGKAFA
jgi:DNA-binding XRE family transcriptional regulator